MRVDRISHFNGTRRGRKALRHELLSDLSGERKYRQKQTVARCLKPTCSLEERQLGNDPWKQEHFRLHVFYSNLWPAVRALVPLTPRAGFLFARP